MPATQTYPLDPFTTEGAKRIAAIAGQPTASISADQLTAGSAMRLPQVVTPPMPSTPAVPTIDEIFNAAETPTQTAAKDLTRSIAGTEGDLAGETAYRTAQEGALDITGKRKTVNDLTTQLNNLKTEADQIPLSLQNAYEGRGVTAAGLAPIQAGELRKNAIRQLGVSAMLQAANGNLATAQDQVDAAVKAKFDPLKAELEAKKAQLDAITPLLNAEEKKLAAKQSAQLAERSKALDKQQEDQKTVYQTMLAAAQNGADAVTLRNIEAAATPDAAITAAGSFLTKPDTQVVNAGGRVYLVNSKTGAKLADLGVSDAALKVANTAPKAPTATQITYGNYAPRLQTADKTIQDLTASITSMAPVSYTLSTHLPSWLQGGDLQRYNQAKLNFVNAVLRQESGAAISDSERAQYEKQYFPVPGDTPETVAQKASNRAQVVQSYIKDAGPAYAGPANDPYADYRSQLQQGEILVQRGSQIIAITPDELQANDERL